MTAPAPRRQLISLLASPPALRSDFARHFLSRTNTSSVGVTRSLATISARQRTDRKDLLLRTRTHICTATSIPTAAYIIGARFQSSASSAPASSASNPTTTTTTPPSRSRRILVNSLFILLAFTTGAVMAAAPAAEAVNGFLTPPTNEESLHLFEPATPNAAEINDHIVNHPLSKKLRATEGMVESRPYLKIPPALRPFNLTGGCLMGENKIEVPPLAFADKDAELPTLTQISYLGPALCGHPDIIHGGLLATMLDEGLAWACFPALPNKVGVTASLKIDYRLPCPASSYVVLRAQTTKVEGRKAWVKGWIEVLGEEDGTGTKVVEAEALFIEPKQAAQMAKFYNRRD